MANGQTCTLTRFDNGHDGAKYHGIVYNGGESTWRPDGMNYDKSEWDIVELYNEALANAISIGLHSD